MELDIYKVFHLSYDYQDTWGGGSVTPNVFGMAQVE